MVMMYEELIQPVKRKFKIALCCRVNDTGSPLLIECLPFTNRRKCYLWLQSMGTVYAERKGNEFRRPLLTYETFTRLIKKGDPQLLHVAKTGVFAGRYYVQILDLK